MQDAQALTRPLRYFGVRSFLRRSGAWLLPALMPALMAAMPLPARAAVDFEVIHEFNEGHGASPEGSMALGPDGSLHGATYWGDKRSRGVFFRIGIDGDFSVDYELKKHRNKRAGSAPQGGLIYATDGRFYGTTAFGRFIRGAVVALDANTGVLKAVYSFTGGDDGYRPESGVIQGTDGNLYGTTTNVSLKRKESDTAAGCCGTVFRVTLDGEFKTLHQFKASESDWPNGLVEGPDGALYGTARGGGATNGGTFFRMTTDGTVTVLHAFDRNGTKGYVPANRLLLASDGNFYGGTARGGEFGYGTLFRMTPTGEMTDLYSFQGSAPNGAWPVGTLIQASNGNIYGTTLYGGNSNRGTIFRLTLGGEVTTLHKFSGPDGENPNGGLTQSIDGLLYGTAEDGGGKGHGVIFRLKAE